MCTFYTQMLTIKKTKQLLPTISCSTFTTSINANFSQIQLLTVLKVLRRCWNGKDTMVFMLVVVALELIQCVNWC
jgi:hypothetical protein